MAGLGVTSKAAFKIEGGSVTGTGMASAAYPTTEATADAEEVKLGSSDQIPFTSEGVEQEHSIEVAETITGSPGVGSAERVSIMGGGSVEVSGTYDGMDGLIACAMGYEHSGTSSTQKPDYTKGTGEISGTATGGSASTVVDSGNPFGSNDAQIGKFVRIKGNVARSGQVRRITDSTNSTLTVSPNFDANPAASDGYEVSNEFQHLFEMSKQLNDELWTDENSSYPTTGVGTSNDKIIRRGTFGVEKGTSVWVWRSCYVNSMTLAASAGSGLTGSFELIPFNLDKGSATNTASTTWDWKHGKSGANLFTPQENERAMFSDVAYFRIGAYSTVSGGALSSSDDYGISDFSISVNNNLSADAQSTTSGVHRMEPVRGGHREVSGSFSLPRYDSDTFINWLNNQTKLMAQIQFQGSTMETIARKFEIFLSSIVLTKGSAPVGGPDALTQSFEFTALVPAGQPYWSDGTPVQNITAPRSEMVIQVTNQNPYHMLRDQNKEY